MSRNGWGTVIPTGSAWFLASIGPKILRVNLTLVAKEVESEMGAGDPELGVTPAYSALVARAYRLSNPKLIGKKVEEIEATVKNERIFVEQIGARGTIALCVEGVWPRRICVSTEVLSRPSLLRAAILRGTHA